MEEFSGRAFVSVFFREEQVLVRTTASIRACPNNAAQDASTRLRSIWQRAASCMACKQGWAFN